MLDRMPQVFISYSWTSKEYLQKVIDLASRMRHDGVDVKLDVWDLKTGQDKYKYMEQCVSNPEIDRVLILSDRIYDSMWKKLVSIRFCEKVMPVFGVDNIEDLKSRIENCKTDRAYRYSSGWVDPATSIMTWIKPEEVGTLP